MVKSSPTTINSTPYDFFSTNLSPADVQQIASSLADQPGISSVRRLSFTGFTEISNSNQISISNEFIINFLDDADISSLENTYQFSVINQIANLEGSFLCRFEHNNLALQADSLVTLSQLDVVEFYFNRLSAVSTVTSQTKIRKTTTPSSPLAGNCILFLGLLKRGLSLVVKELT